VVLLSPFRAVVQGYVPVLFECLDAAMALLLKVMMSNIGGVG
jgi:hypothetical protein